MMGENTQTVPLCVLLREKKKVKLLKNKLRDLQRQLGKPQDNQDNIVEYMRDIAANIENNLGQGE